MGRFFGEIKVLPARDHGSGSGSGSPGVGFFRAEAGALGDPSPFPDVRTCAGLRLTLRAAGEGAGYPGFLLGFGSARPANAAGTFRRARGYRAALRVPPSKPGDGDGGSDGDAAYGDVDVPFAAFTMAWDAGTGEELVTCADDVSNCPDDATRADPRVCMHRKGCR